jgi:hypothetical protein
MTFLGRSTLIAFLWLPLVSAQAVVDPPAQPAGVAAKDHEDFVDKLLGIAGPAEPSQLTEKKRFLLYITSTVGPVPILAELTGAAVGQWDNDPKEWGQGWNAYRKRAESDLAYNGVRETIAYGTSILFHEDNRYFASHRHGFWRRSGYAVLSTVTARHPDGRTTFSFSSVAGVFGAAGFSSLWGPPSFGGVSGIGENAGISFGCTALFNVVREFMPDVLHRPRN